MKRNRSLNTTNGGINPCNYMFRPEFVAIFRLQSSSVKSFYTIMLLDFNLTMASNTGRNMYLRRLTSLLVVFRLQFRLIFMIFLTHNGNVSPQN
jgi:hypothetical protein